MSDIKSGGAESRFIDQVAAQSWAATQVPEITVASQSFLKARFFRAVHVEFSLIIRDECLYLIINGFGAPSFTTPAESSLT
jgi:hypothetical protein